MCLLPFQDWYDVLAGPLREPGQDNVVNLSDILAREFREPRPSLMALAGNDENIVPFRWRGGRSC